MLILRSPAKLIVVEYIRDTNVCIGKKKFILIEGYDNGVNKTLTIRSKAFKILGAIIRYIYI